jgi:hypothetical protein
LQLTSLDPLEISSYREAEIERLFDAAVGGPTDWIINGGQKEIDVARRLISNGRSWRGFLPPDHTLNAYSASLFNGYQKEVSRQGSHLVALTSDTMGRLHVRSVLEEIEIMKVSGDLKPGRYILARNVDPPWQGIYEILRIVSRDVVLGRAYLGEYPNGVRLFHFAMAHRYGFEQMLPSDHRDLFDSSNAPNAVKLRGIWRMDALGLAGSAGCIAYLRLDPKPDGRLESAFEAAGLVEHLMVPRAVAEHFKVPDFHGSADETRRLGEDFLIGRQFLAATPEISMSPAAAVGLLRPAEAGQVDQYCLQYLLSRVGELP